MIKRLIGGTRALHEDEEGAALVFAAITLFSLALSTFLVFQVGLVSTDRMQIQSAADAAAYSGAQVEANAINSIGQLNDGMAYVHYTTLRHVVDSIVYSTLAEYGHHAEWVNINASDRLMQMPLGCTMPGIDTEFGPGIENQDAPGWVMLGDEAEWDQRWGRVERQRGAQVIEAGKRWLLDLNAANRRILEAMPDLIREKAAEVAFLNGASHVAVSSDMEQVWQANEDGSGDVGFVEAMGTEQSGSDGQRVAAALPFRYGGAKDGYAGRSLSVDGEPRGFPDWFDAETGKARGDGYTQVRLCWNVNDWAHRQQTEQHMGFEWQAAPNGHWHGKHEHSYMDNTTDPPTPRVEEHGGLTGGGGSVREAQCSGGGTGGGHMQPNDDDPILHQKVQMSSPPIDPLAMDPHHAVVYCPTCYHSDTVRGGTYSQLIKRQQQAEERGAVVELALETSDFPKPLFIAPALLRSAVTVATWRDSHGVGDVLPASEWGMIAVASAQIGYLDPQGRVQALERIDNRQASYAGGQTVPLERDADASYRNLFYSADPQKGVRFGARLVPLAGEFTHHASLTQGGAVDELLDPQTARERWWTTSDPERPAPSNMTQEAPMAALTALRPWVAVPSFEAVKRVFWH